MIAFNYAACRCGIYVSSTVGTQATATTMCQRCWGAIDYATAEVTPVEKAIQEFDEAAKRPRHRPPKNHQQRREWWNR